MLLSKKEFIGFYNTEISFYKIRGIKIGSDHKKELDDMKHIYDISNNNKEFTVNMCHAGYGKLE